ncbi:antitoxin (DNA-binding transcriptional repressor) of toxin-antitoxin stability system [Stackebrandtia endophytica]|uniref:Antitoxin (DNA-binding transcriptional repressor) of toxin-antitoxin stability system n=1 Tax=Stackebrandtia endophytica TaxID=1496996 RepID=A0A543B2E5_9ACTN|nr:prevent-host-death protein [Stackebrandtia endophytica]TQL79008.1 antitoxin (DNA-binding transcriptional repressor) of toxin-antitoxin stability system [Stackebrandtia endophytica]
MSALPSAQYNIHEAEPHSSEIVKHGEEIPLRRAGRPFTKVVPLPACANRRGYGTLRGRITMAHDGDAPAAAEVIARDFGLSE